MLSLFSTSQGKLPTLIRCRSIALSLAIWHLTQIKQTHLYSPAPRQSIFAQLLESLESSAFKATAVRGNCSSKEFTPSMKHRNQFRLSPSENRCPSKVFDWRFLATTDTRITRASIASWSTVSGHDD